MGIGKSRNSYIAIEDVEALFTQFDILNFYLSISDLPILINSPLREDRNPSFFLYSPDNHNVYYQDFATKEHGSIFQMLSELWGLSFTDTLHKICNDLHFGKPIYTKVGRVYRNKTIRRTNSLLKCKVRDWEAYDLEYWASYGISLRWLKLAEVYPISHKIIIKGDQEYVFSADKYAYAFIERKEQHITLKIYQPFNTKGFKWNNNHDSSVISLWAKLPKTGNKVVICASLKDALCLWANTGVPAVALQGEGYNISNTALEELRGRFREVYICFDNDEPGIINASHLSKLTGFCNIQLPIFKGGKDISDYYKIKGKQTFIDTMSNLLCLTN